MCGRTACTLCKVDLQKAVQTYSSGSNAPPWVQKYSWQNYVPKYNLAPGDISPVLIKGDGLCTEVEDFILFPMKWGLVPQWYTGSVKDYTLKTNNCRYESILEKPMFKSPLISGRRCIVLADGFYEWKTIQGKKQPYFIHFPEEQGVKIYDRSWENSDSTQTDFWRGPRLLTMAGIFDVWKSSEFGELFSYSVITMPSSKVISSIHHRMPAILDGNEQVRMWLDTKNVSHKEALSNLKSIENLALYPVSTEVNNSKNNTLTCVKPLSHDGKKGKETGLTAWLKRPSDTEKNSEKKLKLSNK